MPLTVGDIRKLIADLPDDAAVYPDWAADRFPSNCDPGVELCGARVSTGQQGEPAYLSIEVGLFDLDDHQDGQECGYCGEVCDDVESTFCGSMCGECRKLHAEGCEVCRKDFASRGI